MHPCEICGTQTNAQMESIGYVCTPCQQAGVHQCGRCQTLLAFDDAILDLYGNMYCEACHQEYYHFCHACGSQVNHADRYLHSGHPYCNQCRQQFTNICRECNSRVSGYSLCRHGGDIYCQSCYEDTFAYCHRCDESRRIEDMTQDSYGYLCEDCESRRDRWDMKEFKPEENTYEETGSKRTFGVEIETARCSGFSQIYQDTIWGCTDDYSISGKEFISPPLKGDKGLEEIRSFCAMALDRRWRVNSNCGLHVHIGMGDMSPKALKRIAYAYHLTYKLWTAFVSPNRDCNRMCGQPRCSIDDILAIDTNNYEDWDLFVSKQDRFEFLNWRAFIVHGTVELRIMDGSLDGDLICNWVKAHIKFIEYVAKKSLEDIKLMFSGSHLRQFSAFAEVVGSGLASYYVDVSESYDKYIVAKQNRYLPF